MRRDTEDRAFIITIDYTCRLDDEGEEDEAYLEIMDVLKPALDKVKEIKDVSVKIEGW